MCNTIREAGVALIFDRFFTSVRLLQMSPFACVGTVMANRKNLPKETNTKSKTSKQTKSRKMNRGESQAQSTDVGVICYKWQDTKEVMSFSKRNYKSRR